MNAEQSQTAYREKCTHRRNGKNIEAKAEDEWNNIEGSPFKSINAAKRNSRKLKNEGVKLYAVG